MNVSFADSTRKQTISAERLPAQLLQPRSTPVLKTKMPQNLLEKVLVETDRIVNCPSSSDHGSQLVGEIDKETSFPLETLDSIGAMSFFENMVREYVILFKCKEHPFSSEIVKSRKWKTEVTSCWIVSQRPNEYNPVHSHHGHVSAVVYLEVPQMKVSRKSGSKESGSLGKDGFIEFLSPGSRDRRLCQSQLSISPVVGDFYLFGAGQFHTVYPYRCYKGDMDTERRSLSFNALFEEA